MSRAKRRRERSGRRGPGAIVLGLLGGAIIAGGFATGLLSGILLEEPALVVDHLTGNTTPVALEDADPAARVEAFPEPPVPEIPSGRERRSAGVERPDAGPSPPPSPGGPASPGARRPDVAAAPPGGGFAVQVGAFADREAARRLQSSLREAGLAVYLAPAEDPQGTRWRVRVGPVATRQEAERLADRLKRERKLPTWVLADSGR